MKRSPLARGSALLRRSPMPRRAVRRGGGARGAAKRAAWAVRSAAARAAHPTCAGRGVLPGACWGPLDTHHLVVRGMGGVAVDDSPLAVLCRTHHERVHLHADEARALGFRIERGAA